VCVRRYVGSNSIRSSALAFGYAGVQTTDKIFCVPLACSYVLFLVNNDSRLSYLYRLCSPNAWITS